MADGWSVKKLVREIVLSRTYRQASTYRRSGLPRRSRQPAALAGQQAAARRRGDPRRHARRSRRARRHAAGRLAGGPADRRPADLADRPRSSLPADLDGSRHRSVYLPVLRDRLPDVLDLFDFAEPSLVTGDRETTNVPVQALYLMNSPFVQARAKALADRLLREADDDDERIRRAFLLCFGRSPDADETKMAAIVLRTRPVARPADDETGERQVLAGFCQALLATAEFRNLD